NRGARPRFHSSSVEKLLQAREWIRAADQARLSSAQWFVGQIRAHEAVLYGVAEAPAWLQIQTPTTRKQPDYVLREPAFATGTRGSTAAQEFEMRGSAPTGSDQTEFVPKRARGQGTARLWSR